MDNVKGLLSQGWQRRLQRLEPLAARLSRWMPLLAAPLSALFPGQRAEAATLPEQRADLLYHLYDGGGETVQGPALLVRKNFLEKFSVTAGYYVDKISGASIDVVTTASPYHELRHEVSGGADYLYRDTLMSVGYTDSNEHDYKAHTWDFSVSQDMFENRTTLTLGYAMGNDTVGKVNSNLSAPANRDNYSLSVAQVINPTFIGTLSYELSADDGYLQNPYRSARISGAFVPEVDPTTRSGDAAALKFVKSWSPAWSSRVEFRYYWDSWGIHGYNVGLGASHTFPNHWLVDASYRFYQQQGASFYSDNFSQPETYVSRDKELAHFHSYTLGSKLTVPLWNHHPGSHAVINSVDVNLAYDYMITSYANYTDIRDGSLYSFGASIAQLFFTVRY